MNFKKSQTYRFKLKERYFYLSKNILFDLPLPRYFTIYLQSAKFEFFFFAI